jgi:1-pyrroline-5-carboxylate dehydrogenase
MGGKDSILVCADADLDAAVEAVVASAFGFSGQKCSACSRAIIEAPIYEIFTERLRERVAQLTVGDPAANTNLGPVINNVALNAMLAAIETGLKEGQLIVGGHALTTLDGGFFLEPTIFSEIPPNGVLAQEEIFGPVLALIKVADFEEGLRVANNTEYGLTGSIYTSDRERLNRARHEFHVGNLYLNRKCTGAMVGAHPFGGFNMSGTDSKAGGPDYLLLFTQSKSVAEKL